MAVSGRSTILRQATAALAVFAVVVAVVMWLPPFWPSEWTWASWTFGTTSSALAIAGAATALLVTLRGTPSRPALLFALAAASLAVWSVADYGLSRLMRSLDVVNVWAIYLEYVALAIGLAALVHFVQVFPPSPAPAHRGRPVPIVLIWLAAGLLSVVMVADLYYRGVDLRFRWKVPQAATVASLLVVVATLRARVAQLRVEERSALRWLIFGCALAAVIASAYAAYTLGLMVQGYRGSLLAGDFFVTKISLLALLICMWVPLFVHGAIDPTVAIERTVVLGTLGVGVVFLFATAEGAFSSFLEQALGVPGILGAAFLAGLLAISALPFRHPARRLYQRWSASLVDTPLADAAGTPNRTRAGDPGAP
jgi:hypothetical protein